MGKMAIIDGDLAALNLARVVYLDASDDARLAKPPLPNDCYPVLGEAWMMAAALPGTFAGRPPVTGYRYEWHDLEEGTWYVGLVDATLAPRTA